MGAAHNGTVPGRKPKALLSALCRSVAEERRAATKPRRKVPSPSLKYGAE